MRTFLDMSNRRNTVGKEKLKKKYKHAKQNAYNINNNKTKKKKQLPINNNLIDKQKACNNLTFHQQINTYKNIL